MKPRRDCANDKNGTEARINAIKQQLLEKSAGQMVVGESSALPAKQREAFWRRVLAFENGPFTTDFERLTEAGLQLPEPEMMDDAALTVKLWEVITALARLRVFISQTDHLSDRELYAYLWHESFRDEIPVLPDSDDDDDDGAWHVSPLGGQNAEEIHLYLKFYAGEDERQTSLRDFPERVMPPHEDPPYDRDRRLPKP